MGPMGARSAGLLVYRWCTESGGIEVLIGHMGGPFWAGRDSGAWTVPKGEYSAGEPPEAAALREFSEEVGLPVPTGELIDLGAVRQSGGKEVRVWAIEGDLDPSAAVSNTFELEWPPRSGRVQVVPELDRLEWVRLDQARELLVRAQQDFLDRLGSAVGLG